MPRRDSLRKLIQISGNRRNRFIKGSLIKQRMPTNSGRTIERKVRERSLERATGRKAGRERKISERESEMESTLYFSQFPVSPSEKETPRDTLQSFLLHSPAEGSYQTVERRTAEERIKRGRDRRTNQTRPIRLVSREERMLPLDGQDNLNFPARCTPSTYLDHSAKQN